MKVCLRFFLCLVPFVLPSAAEAQVLRFELGQRLRAFEAAWEQQPDAAARARAVQPLTVAVNSFFSGRLSEVGRNLDKARHALGGENAVPASIQWADTLYLVPEGRMVDPVLGKLLVTLERLYPIEEKIPAGAMVRVEVLAATHGGEAGKSAALTSIEAPVVSVPQQIVLAVGKLPEGDHTLRLSVCVGEKVLASSNQLLSSINQLMDRLNSQKKQLESLSGEPGTADHATARSLVALLERLAGKETLETNYPAARLLREVEELTKSLAAGKSFYGKERSGQFWMTLAGKSTAAVRVFIPETAKAGKPLPLVVALHGAGGSENLFFDGYGDGKVMRLARERGWLLVAPRSGLLGGGNNVAGLIDALAALYPVDAKRVFVVGHSMGAGQAVSGVQQHPERIAAVAALGGSGRVSKTEPIRGVPFFIGVGDKDFALRGARNLSDQLKKGGVKDVRLKEYADVEHMVIVQEALPDVFKFFDEKAR